MERENFYILLDLSVNPPDDDPQIIAKAIKDKQALWNLHRNHSTKGVAAEHYISMLPEIERVMNDPALRILEVDTAIRILFDREKEKYAKIDKHILLCMSKGYITDEEIFKLAKIHRIDATEIRGRIKAVDADKIKKIDEQLRIRMTKGYITEAEISQVSKIHSVEEADDIRSRTTSSVRKDAFAESDGIKPLDKSIGKIIEENLKRLSSSFLYQFLNVPFDSGLEKIEKSIDINDGGIKKTEKKDAKVTASFIPDESRYDHDVILAQSNLAELNSSIDVAGMDGIIRAEYFDTLVNLAMNIGMEVGEAEQYIAEYCKNKEWTMESKEKKISKKIRYAAGVLLIGIIAVYAIVIIAGYTMAIIDSNKKKRLENDYQLMLADFNSQKDLKQKKQVLRNFIASSPPGEFTAAAKVKMNEIARLVDQSEYDKFILEIDLLEKEKKYTRGIDACEQYLKKNPKTNFARDLKEKIIFLSRLNDDFDYEKVQEEERTLDIEPRLSVYTGYLKKHPDGQYVDIIEKKISSMSGEYYAFFTKKILIYEKNEDWQKGILLADKFIAIYKNNNRIPGIKKIQNRFHTFLWEKEAFGRLRKKAEGKKEQFAVAKQIYYDFLYAYPDTYVKEKINREIAKLDLLEKNAGIEATKIKIRNMIQQVGGGRYLDNNDGTVKDTKTGLTWSMLDSSINSAGDRLDYANAVSHVKKMRTGGYQDWRLPTRDELETIYKKKPYFPQTEAPWYWTSESYSRYSGGWSKIVDIVTSINQDASAAQRVDAREFGWVRAVRK